jgi:fructose-1,6-bisphosphatase/inositol monophosphatase family enzyme
VRSWIWQPQHRRGYVAERGAGAWADGRLLRRALPSADRSGWRGVTSRRRWIGRELDGVPPLELTWISCGIDYPHLVEGDADFVLYHRAAPWDHAPGGLLLAEAGGHLGTFAGATYLPRGWSRVEGLVAAAAPSVYDALLPLLPSP